MVAIRSFVGKRLQSIGLKRQTVLALNALGLGAGLNSGDPVLDVRLFMRRSRHDLPQLVASSGAGRVLFAGTFGSGAQFSLTVSLMAQAMRLRQADARVLRCDAALPGCELAFATHFSDVDEFVQCSILPSCASCTRTSGGIFEGFQLPLFQLGDFTDVQGYHRAWQSTEGLSLKQILTFEYDGLDLGDHVRTSMYKFFLAGTLPDDEITRLAARRFLASGIVLANALRRLFAEWRPDVVVVHHGIYLLGGVVNEVAAHEGIRVVAWDFHYRRHSLILSHGRTYHFELREEPTDTWEHTPLTLQQRDTLERYLTLKRLGKVGMDDVSYNAGNLVDRERVIHEIGVDPNRRVVVLFPNLMWDGRIKTKSPLYDGLIEWMADTISYLAEREDVQVVVRIHPAEAREKSWRGLQRVGDEIRKAVPAMPSNVILIAPETKVNSYTLAELAHVSGVFASQIGLEILMMGLPVMIVNDAVYANKGFGLQPTTRQEYLRLLDRLEEIQPPGEEEMERIRRYAYHFYFRRQIQIPFFYDSAPDAPFAATLSDLLPGRSEGLDRVCEGILHGRPFHLGAP